MEDINDSRALGALIRSERKRQRMTQVQLADSAGVGVRFLRELENGKETCQMGLAIRVLVTLGIKLSAETRAN